MVSSCLRPPHVLLGELVRAEGEFLFREVGPFGEELGAFGLAPVQKNTFQPVDDGKDDALLFVGFEFAAQAFGRFPDLVGEIVEFGFIEGKGHRRD